MVRGFKVSAQVSALACLALLIAGPQAWALPSRAALPGKAQRLDFTVLRNGDQIGHDIISLDPQGDTLTVDVETHIVVRVAFVPVYRFEHKGSEIWRDGRLVGLISRTDDDGTKHQLAVRGEGAGLRIDCDGKTSDSGQALIPASLWNIDLVRQSVLLNTLDGTQMNVRVEDLGPEPVEARHATIQARHYRVSGGLTRELWYADDGGLVRVAFSGSDGSHITYVLQ